ncbi:hypothetical protein RRG08_021419 [Elysia crispata]|uniref:Uncharacterized protein n=1 Tax=Elysia crispata TaxID=231223 RepID=A0AAE1A6C5_9GAST|nr:hypothetical protein RRG08_021419 [Elysia crispata]
MKWTQTLSETVVFRCTLHQEIRSGESQRLRHGVQQKLDIEEGLDVLKPLELSQTYKEGSCTGPGLTICLKGMTG